MPFGAASSAGPAASAAGGSAVSVTPVRWTAVAAIRAPPKRRSTSSRRRPFPSCSRRIILSTASFPTVACKPINPPGAGVFLLLSPAPDVVLRFLS
ncbi:hypothetical protein GCM10009566_59090 [Streptomyces murinus]